MNINKVISLFILMVIIGFIQSCSPVPAEHFKTKTPSNVYDSAFPDINDSKALIDIMKSVKRINSTVYYRSYLFNKTDQITSDEVPQMDLKKFANKIVSTNHSTSGTATIIYKSTRNIALITCAHIVSFPDTVITYYKRANLAEREYVRSVSVKKRQVNLVLALPDLGYYKILAINRKDDIAILGASLDQFSNSNIPVLRISVGDASKLQWASFVYIIGYPQGFKMITRAIVSNPDRDDYNSFIMDALFNRGFSGGLVLAVKDGVPNFEWVGIANSATAKTENVLKPDESLIGKYDAYTPYQGPIYLGQRSHIDYGITQAISIKRIKTFLRENNHKLLKDGYNFSYIFR